MRREIVTSLFTIQTAANIGTKYYFRNDPNISGKIFGGLMIPEPSVEISSSLFFGVSGLTPATTAQLKNVFITFCDKDGKEIYKDLPYIIFDVRKQRGNIRDMLWNRISIERSYIKFQIGTISAKYILLNFILYSKK